MPESINLILDFNNKFNDLKNNIWSELESIGIQVLNLEEFNCFCFSLYKVLYLNGLISYNILNTILPQVFENYNYFNTSATIKNRINYYEYYLAACLDKELLFDCDPAMLLALHLTDYISDGLESKQFNIFILTQKIQDIVKFYQNQ